MSNRQLASNPAPGSVPNHPPLADTLFEPLAQSTAQAEKISRPALTYFQDAFLRLKKNRIAMSALAFIGAITLVGVLGPLFFPGAVDGVPYENQQNSNFIDQSPTKGETLRVIDDYALAPEDQVDPNYNASAPLVAPEQLVPPGNLVTIGSATVNGVTLQWDPVPGASGYSVYRLVIPGAGLDKDALVNGTIERGVNVGEVSNPAQHSLTDGLGLDASERYAYTVLSYVEDPNTMQKSYSEKGVVVTAELSRTIKLSDAKTIDPNAEVGQEIHGRPHLFGTDSLGRDTLARMVQGTRVDMLLALLVPTICIVFGLIFGAFSGLMGGKVDSACMRVVEVFDNFPDLLVFIILQVAIGKGLFSLVVALSAFSWAGFARLVRGEVLRMRELEFVQASRLLGAPVGRLILRHIGPNLFGLIIIAWSARIPGVIASEAFLSLLGLGLEQPTPSWGNVVFDAARRLQVNPIQFFLPTSVLALTLLAFYLLGDAMRDAFDPKLRGRT